jgi:hypothetical protein
VDAAAVLGGDGKSRRSIVDSRQSTVDIRDIAQLWGADPRGLHKEYTRARQELAEALREVVQEHQRCPPERLEEECRRLLELLH